jgi:nucleoid-associated protein YgaU
VRVAAGRAAAITPHAAATEQYVVRPGDTLAAIAERHGTTWPVLWALNRNRIADPDLIYPGQVLRVPPRRPR